MKVITIKEPFASLVADGIKKVETRSWETNYRGEIYIHAGLTKVPEQDERIKKLITFLPSKKFLYGHIIAKGKLVNCIYMDEKFLETIENNPIEKLCGHYEKGRYAWVIEDIQRLEHPILVKGKLGIWNYENNNQK